MFTKLHLCIAATTRAVLFLLPWLNKGMVNYFTEKRVFDVIPKMISAVSKSHFNRFRIQMKEVQLKPILHNVMVVYTHLCLFYGRDPMGFKRGRLHHWRAEDWFIDTGGDHVYDGNFWLQPSNALRIQSAKALKSATNSG